jgi:hypothetical protein
MSGATAVTQACPFCGKIETNAVPTDGYLAWKGGMLIQRAMPEVNECIREFLITGFCEDCRAENDRISEEMENTGNENEDAEAF